MASLSETVLYDIFESPSFDNHSSIAHSPYPIASSTHGNKNFVNVSKSPEISRHSQTNIQENRNDGTTSPVIDGDGRDLISFSDEFACDPELLKTTHSRVSIGEMENLVDSMINLDESAFPESLANESINGEAVNLSLQKKDENNDQSFEMDPAGHSPDHSTSICRDKESPNSFSGVNATFPSSLQPVDDFSVLFQAGDQKNLQEFFAEEQLQTEKEHAFIQEIDMDAVKQNSNNTSVWSIAQASQEHRFEKPSWINNSASSAVSTTTYFRSGSCPLGSSLDKPKSNRPEFGYTIDSPGSQSQSSSRRSTLDSGPAKNSDKSNGHKKLQKSKCSDTSGRRSTLSLSEIRRLVNELSVSANSSTLVEAILNAKRQLADRSSNETLVTSPVSEKKPEKGGASSDRVENNIDSGRSSGYASISEGQKKSAKDSLAPKFQRHPTAIENLRSSPSPRKRKSFEEEPAAAAQPRNGFSKKNLQLDFESTSSKRPQSPQINENHMPRAAVDFSASTPDVYTNKQMINFGCVPLSRCASQAFCLKNNSDTQMLRLRVYLKGDDEHFQIPGAEQDDLILINPKEKYEMKVTFRPSEVQFYAGKIVLATANTSKRCCIPILAYGGHADVRMDNFPGSRGPVFDLTVPDSHKQEYGASKADQCLRLSLHNHGTQAAFFKVLAYTDNTCSTLLKDDRICIEPSCAVLDAGAKTTLDITVSCSMLENLAETNLISCLAVCWGEEVLRKRLKRWESKKNRPMIVKRCRFSEHFANEDSVSGLFDEKDAKQMLTSDDANLFVGHISEYQVRLLAPADARPDASARSFYKLQFDTANFSTMTTPGRFAHLRSTLMASPLIRKNSSQNKLYEVTDIASSPKHMSMMRRNSSTGLSIAPNVINFVDTELGARDTVRIEFRNNSTESNTIYLSCSDSNFAVNCAQYRLDAKKLVRISIHFEPKSEGSFSGFLHVKSSNDQHFQVPMHGNTFIRK